ncbi:MAG: M20/M25/M40 family metallo-hydrolase [Longimicrobiales bacterium]
MSRVIRLSAALLALAVMAAPVAAQNFPTDDPVLHSIWDEGMNRSQVYPLAQTLLDSIGPRVTGSTGLDAAHDWLVGLYEGWGIEAENQQYGTWRGWERGAVHVDLLEPRVRTLDATLLAWSRGTDGQVEGDVMLLPEPGDDLMAWLRNARGAFVLASPNEPTCRPLDQWEELGDASVYEGIVAAREAAHQDFGGRAAMFGDDEAEMVQMLADAGVAGVLTSSWSGGYGTRRVFGDRVGLLPTFSVSCEHFGMLYRLAAAGQGPVVRADARAELRGEVPVYNTVGMIRGTERPDEYVLLSAHLDSWDGAPGATDNGTGTIIMAEAMRLLNRFYPNPKRTIMVGHWGSEEQGLNGSRAFVADHPDIVDALQAVFNQDNGTGKIARVSMQGLMDAGPHFAAWLSALPGELTSGIDATFPGTPGGGGSDYAAFVCAGAPGFGLWSDSWDYGTYTWHTNMDTFDKLALDNVRHNAVLIAMLAYMAAEDPDFIDRERRSVLPMNSRTGERMEWPACREPDRSWEGYGH